jgi:hypothetical protein
VEAAEQALGGGGSRRAGGGGGGLKQEGDQTIVETCTNLKHQNPYN